VVRQTGKGIHRSMAARRHAVTQKLSFLFVGLLVLGVTTGSAQDTNFTFDRGTDFSKYRTYLWDNTPGPGHTTYPADAQIAEALDAELATKGLTKTDSNVSDLSICYHSAFGAEKFNKYKDPEWEGHWFTIQTGQVAIDMYDSSSKQLVWRNVASISPKARPKDIMTAVSMLLKNYPPKKK